MRKTRLWYRILTFIGALFLVSEASRAEIQRFWTTTGLEPQGHDVYPDYGNRREFFKTGDKTWVERFADGYVLAFDVAGRQQVPVALVTGQPRDGMVNGWVLKAATSDLRYFIPDEISPSANLVYRLGDSGSFLPSGATIRLLSQDDQSSRLSVYAIGGIGSVRDQLFGELSKPLEDNPDGYRYRFDALTDSRYRQVSLANNRFYLAQVFQGDAETTAFLGPLGCHLKPVYPELHIDFEPQLIESDGNWKVVPADVHADIKLQPGSDTHCSAINWDATFIMSMALDKMKARIKEKVKEFGKPIQIKDIWDKMQTPIIRSIGGQNACLYLSPEALWTGKLTTTAMDKASIELAVTGAPRVTFADSCAVAPQKTFRMFDGSKPAFSRLTFDLVIPYSQIRNSILSSPDIQNAGIDDVGIDDHQAYMTMNLHRKTGETLPVNAVPIIGIPLEPGDVPLNLVFADIPGTPGGYASVLTGSNTISLKEQVEKVKQAIKGQFVTGKLTVTVTNDELEDLTLVCEANGLHVYMNLRLDAVGYYISD